MSFRLPLLAPPVRPGPSSLPRKRRSLADTTARHTTSTNRTCLCP